MEELKPLTRDEIEKKIEIFYNALKPYVKDSGFFMSVMLGQVGIESYWGTSTLAKKANNFTGHKFKAPFSNMRPNDYFIKDAGEEVDGEKVVYEDEKWRKYKDIDDWAKHHADWLTQSDWYKGHYREAINAKTPEEQLKALTGVYATDSSYATSVMRVINDYELKKYDQEQVEEVKDKGEDKEMAFPKPAMIDRRTRALGYPGHGVYAKRSKSAIKNIVWHYTATTHMGDGEQVIKNHENYWKNTHGWEIGGYHFYISRNNPKIYWNYDLEKVTYGAGSVNPRTMHISVEASSASNYTAEQIKLREQLTLWLLTNDLKHLSGTDVKGHNFFMSTSCPGYTHKQMDSFGAELNRKIKAGAGSSSTGTTKPAANEIVWPDYRKPTQPFDELKVGDKVTIRKGQSAWYMPSTPKIGKKPSKDFTGDTDIITKVIDVNVSYSKRAYLLKDKVSYILEHDVEEARKSWGEKSANIKTHTVKSGEYLYLIGEKYGITVQNIKDWNSLSSNVIYSGQKLFVEDPSKKSQKPVETVPEDVIESPNTEQPKDEGEKTPAVELKDGEFMWNGVKYKIVEEVI